MNKRKRGDNMSEAVIKALGKKVEKFEKKSEIKDMFDLCHELDNLILMYYRGILESK